MGANPPLQMRVVGKNSVHHAMLARIENVHNRIIQDYFLGMMWNVDDGRLAALASKEFLP